MTNEEARRNFERVRQDADNAIAEIDALIESQELTQAKRERSKRECLRTETYNFPDLLLGMVFAVLFLSAFCALVWAAWQFSVSPVHAAEIDMQKIAIIESSGNPDAYNESSGAIGIFQITPICLDDYNQYHYRKYTTDDLYTPYVNGLVAKWYLETRIPQLLRHYGKPVTSRHVLIAYNCGIKCVLDNRLPAETRQYLQKYGGGS